MSTDGPDPARDRRLGVLRAALVVELQQGDATLADMRQRLEGLEQQRATLTPSQAARLDLLEADYQLLSSRLQAVRDGLATLAISRPQ